MWRQWQRGSVPPGKTGTLRKFIKTARRYRTIQIRAGTHRITATGPLPDDLKTAIDQIHGRTAAR